MASELAPRLTEWQAIAGRHDLPWQRSGDPYRIWLSEIMLQQTQVATVIPYFERFLAALPDVRALARAQPDQVMSLWSGLGYYSRARNLHACAQQIVDRHDGQFPADPQALQDLPGIGRSTAAAIAVFAFDRRAAILDGNVRRVFARVFAIDGDLSAAAKQAELWSIAERELPQQGLKAYTQGLMDLGATLCTRSRPNCSSCPLADLCQARHQDRVDELPAARRRREMPVRDYLMLVALRGRSVALVHRQTSGIWGGLWSLPESALAQASPGTDTDAMRGQAFELALALGLRLRAGRMLAPVRHAFTHFRLRIHPYLAEVDDGDIVADQDAARWFDLASIESAPLPKPVKALLTRHRESEDLVLLQKIPDHKQTRKR